MAKRTLDDQDAREHGVITRHEQMDNGELRFRLVSSDGSAYIRTCATDGGWQNSHFHKAVLETYIAQSGQTYLVELVDGKLAWHPLRPGDVYTTKPLIPHNVYMSSDAILHTVKHGHSTDDPDWHPSAELDARTRSLSIDEILDFVAANK